MNSTIETIRNSSELVWELVCQLEDGEQASSAQLAELSDDDRVIYHEEAARFEAKWRREERYAKKESASIQAAINTAAHFKALSELRRR